MLGEVHSMDGCPSNALEPEDIIRVFQYTSDRPVDIYVEAPFPSKVLGKWNEGKYKQSRMSNYTKKYKNCIDFMKVGCDIYNARFHYIDTREHTQFPSIIHWYLKHSPSMFRLYAILSRPNYYQDIKQYYFDIIDGNNMDKNPIHQIETYNIVPSRMNLPHINKKVAKYLDGAFQYVKVHDSFDTEEYISDFRYLVKKIQHQFKNCEPEFVKYVRKGLDNYLEKIRDYVVRTFETYKKQIEGVFDVMIPGDHSSYDPPTILNSSYLLLHVLLQDLYGIGRMFRVKWSKPHVHGTNHILYTGAAHATSTYKLLSFVPQIKLVKISQDTISKNCSEMGANEFTDMRLELQKRGDAYIKGKYK